MRPLTPKAQTLALACALALAASHPVLAQAIGGGGDVLGATTARDAFIAFLRLCALGACGWGFFQLFTGSFRIGALITTAVGVAGVAKMDAIAGLFGL